MDDGKKIKLIFLGEGSVGKSSIIHRYYKHEFSCHHNVTIQAKKWYSEIVSELGASIIIAFAGFMLLYYFWK
ncbi:hypothetical protein HZS_905 [Henneguya salminicola]|nr:hypothetical protein HZS_905 [Henneguya salminicola]